jgi:hypothetical protein
MGRKNIIVLITPTSVEAWGNFKKLCLAKKLPYHSLKMKEFPIVYKDLVIHRVPFL